MYDDNERNNINSKNDYNVYNEETNSYMWTPMNQDQPVEKYNKKQMKKKAKKERHINKVVLVIILALVFGLIAGGTMFGVNFGLNYFFPSESNQVNIPFTNVFETTATDEDSLIEDNTSTVTDVSKVVEESMPSIVALTTTQVVDYESIYPFYNGDGESQEVESGSGSGIIISKNDTELLIITSNHVVEDSTNVYVKFVNETSVNATVKAAKKDEDLAIVSVPLSSIDEETLSQIKIATLATEDVKVGEGAIAIGNALGYGQSVTTGVISALNRAVTVEELTLSLIQTDAAINPGNSGGALLNMKGEVIGINEAKFSTTGVEGMGFAIPITTKTDIIEQLVNAEAREKVAEANRGYIGISGKDVSSSISKLYNIPEGVYITQVITGGAAELAGIQKTDVIVELNGEEVKSMEDLQEILEYYESGQTVSLKIMTLQNKEYVETDKNITLTGKIN